MGISINTYNYFLHKFIYQIEVILNSEKLDLKIGWKNNRNVSIKFINTYKIQLNKTPYPYILDDE
jgi:hypothetical protein